MKEAFAGFGILIGAYILLSATVFLEIPELIGVALICVCLFASGVLTTRVAGKKGIKGNVAAFALMVVCYTAYFSSREALWAVGLIALPVYHSILAVGWPIGLNWRKNKTEPDGTGQPMSPARKSENHIDY